MQIHFLYATETGTAEMLCEDMRDELGLDAEVQSLADVRPSDLRDDRFYIFVSSTYGTGDLPQMAQPFADALEAEKADLSDVSFAIFGLGDMVFADTFAQGSEGLMALLQKHGATMIGERGIFDASSAEMPEDIGVPWAENIVALLQDKAA